MFENSHIENELRALKKKRSAPDDVLSEANRILTRDLFTESKILGNLKQYNKSFEIIDEEEVDKTKIYTLSEIKHICIVHRLKFLESKMYKPEIPYEVILRIKHLNSEFKKELKEFKIVSTPQGFASGSSQAGSLLFTKTNYGNFYLIHAWGLPLKWNRRIKFWPLRNFETLALTVITFTLLLTLALPTAFITLDRAATYFSGYRVAAFFHLLIFNTGVTAYITFAFAKNFSSSVWNQKNDFD